MFLHASKNKNRGEIIDFKSKRCPLKQSNKKKDEHQTFLILTDDVTEELPAASVWDHQGWQNVKGASFERSQKRICVITDSYNKRRKITPFPMVLGNF